VEAGSDNTNLSEVSVQDLTWASTGWIDRLPVVGKSQGAPLNGRPLSISAESRPKGGPLPNAVLARRAPAALVEALPKESDPGERGLGRAGAEPPRSTQRDRRGLGAVAPVSTSLDTTPLTVEVGPTLDLDGGYASEDPGSHERPGPEGETCGGWWAFECRDCRGTFYAYKGCKQRITCRHCRRRYMQKTYARFNPVIQSMQMPVRFITLTVKNGPDLKERRGHLRKSFRRLRQRVAWKRHVRGGVYAEETTWGKDGWHSHVHIIASGKYFPQDELSELWGKCTGDSVIVDIRKISTKEEASKELLKYCLKESGLSEERLLEANEAFKRARLVGTFGNLYGDEQDEDEDQGKDDGMTCPHCGGGDLYRHLPFSWLPRGPPDLNVESFEICGQYVPGQTTVLPARR